MFICLDCEVESDEGKGWYADFTSGEKTLRCPPCGEKEKWRRHEMMHGNKTEALDSLTEVGERIKYAKYLREKK